MNFKKILALIFAGLSFVYLLKVFTLGHYQDFNSYYNNYIFPFSNSNPYKFSDSVIYPPFFFLFFYPFKIIPLIYSQFIWLTISVASLIFSIFIIFKAYGKSLNSALGYLVLGLSFNYFPVKFTLGMGQVNLIILLFLSLFFYFLKKEETVLSSLFLGLSLNIKVFPILMFFFLILKKRMKMLVYVLLISAALTILGFLFYEKQALYYFLNFGGSNLTSWKLDYYNQSLSGVIGRSFSDPKLREYLRLIISLFLVALTLTASIVKRPKRNDLLIGILITVNLLLNSFSWQHHFVWLILPLIITLFYLLKKPKLMVILIISFLLTGINLKQPLLFPIPMQSHVFFGALLLLFLDYYLYVRD